MVDELFQRVVLVVALVLVCVVCTVCVLDLIVEQLALEAHADNKGVGLLCTQANQEPAIPAAIVALRLAGGKKEREEERVGKGGKDGKGEQSRAAIQTGTSWRNAPHL